MIAITKLARSILKEAKLSGNILLLISLVGLIINLIRLYHDCKNKPRTINHKTLNDNLDLIKELLPKHIPNEKGQLILDAALRLAQYDKATFTEMTKNVIQETKQ